MTTHALPLAALLAAAVLAGCSPGGFTGANTASANMYELASSHASPITTGSLGPRNVQLAVYEPAAGRALDGDRVIVHRANSQISYLDGVLWSDRLPVLVQNRLVEALAASGRFRAVSNGRDKVDPDVSLTSSIQAFQIDLSSGQAVSNVTLSAKVVDERTGSVLARRDFRGSAPVASAESGDHVSAINNAFSSVSGEIVDWVASLNIKPQKGRAPHAIRGTVKPNDKTAGRADLVSQRR